MERMLRNWLSIGASLAALCASAGTVPQTAKPPDGWSRSVDEHSRTLVYSWSATVLGKESSLHAAFYCSSEKTKTETGAIGFEIEIPHPDALSTFHFADFEGPDTPARKRQLLTAAIVRANGTQQRLLASPTGWYSVREGFVFEVSDVFDRKGSTARRALEELATDAAALTIVIADYQASTTRIELTIPMTGKSEDFRWLLNGLK